MAGKFELKKTANGKFMFNLKSGNGQVILTSQMYERRDDALAGIRSVQTNAADDARFERKTSSKGEPFFVLLAGNGQQVGKSEMYSSAAAMENGVESVKKNAPGAAVEDAAA
ncbi:MAG TPA: YegP family protein [Pelomicrobium sp.]|nr:YegP family protein [Pelomicrobium sp.]